MAEGVVEGRIVHVTLPSGRSAGECRPAAIVKVWNAEQGTCNLQVLLDGSNDDGHGLNALVPGAIARATSVTYDRETRDGWHWHWPQDHE